LSFINGHLSVVSLWQCNPDRGAEYAGKLAILLEKAGNLIQEKMTIDN
jgi:hypothetical protein